MTAPDIATTDPVESLLSLHSLDGRTADAAEAGAEEAPAPELDEAALGEDLAVTLDGELETDADFAGVVRSAVDRIGGEILFEMQLDNVPDSGHVAAVSVGDGDGRRFLLVVQPTDGSPLRVEPTEESANPLAALAASYAGLVEAYKKAA